MIFLVESDAEVSSFSSSWQLILDIEVTRHVCILFLLDDLLAVLGC